MFFEICELNIVISNLRIYVSYLNVFFVHLIHREIGDELANILHFELVQDGTFKKFAVDCSLF